MEAGLETLAAVETPEQIGLDVELAGIGSRFLAYLIDLCWQSLMIIVAIVAAVMLAHAQDLTLTSTHPESMYLSTWGLALVSLVFFIVNFGYFTFFEMIWRGQTPGKRELSLRVLREGGYPLDFGASFLRNLLRVVDFLPFGYVVGVTAMVLGQRWQRIGDLAGRTWVVRESPEGVGRLLTTGGDRRLAADMLERLGSMEPTVGDTLMREVAGHIARRRHEAPPETPAAYLAAVAGESAA
jgi:uncharacterized RDD family membrane protein YckC